MDPILAVTLGAAVALSVALLKAPIALSLLAGGIVGLWGFMGFDMMLNLVGSTTYGVISNQSLLLVPLYILIGMAVTTSGMADELFAIAARVFRRVPGALGVAAVAACGGFSAVTGSSAATATTMSKVAFGPMVKQGYPAALTSGLIAAGGGLGVLIPPSLMLVLYGVIAEESIGALLVAGLVPGLLVMVLYAGYVVVVARVQKIGTVDARVVAEVSEISHKVEDETVRGATGGGVMVGAGDGNRDLGVEKIDYSPAFHITIIFAITLAGIYTGLLTITESAAMGAVVALTLACWRVYRSGGSSWNVLSRSFLETVKLSSVVFALLIGGMVFSKFLISTGLTGSLSAAIQNFNASPYVVLLCVILLLLPLGMFLDPMSIMLIFIPILHPLMMDLGFEGIWFAIIFVRMMEIAGITPPVGLNAFVVSGSVPGLKVETVFKGAFPFVILDFVSIAIFVAFPAIILFLPNMVG